MKYLSGVLAAAIFAFSAAHAQSDGPPVASEAVSATENPGAAAEPEVDYFARDKFEIETIVCPFKGKIDYKPGEISCGLLTVPENREKSRSRYIKLMFVELHARKPKKWDEKEKGEWKKREDPIIYLTGGPGAQVSAYVKRFKDHGARDVRDMYILEQRGIGNSGDFCLKYSLFDPAVSNVKSREEYDKAGLAAMENCFAEAKAARIDLKGYNTIENARDVEALRRALGFRKWNVWGISYGSILGQAYIKQDPAGIRAVVLDAIVPIIPGAHFQRVATHYSRDLGLLTDACKADKACARNFPDFEDKLKKAMLAVNETPIEVDAIDDELFPTKKAWFHADIIGALPFIQLYEQKNYPTLPAFIDALSKKVEKKDYAAFRAITSGLGGGGPDGFSISQGMYNAIACNDGWVRQLKDALARDREEFPALGLLLPGPEIIEENEKICRRYGMPARAESDYTAVETDIPAIIAEGQMDPITPPPLAKMIVPGFSRGTYVEFPYSGHGPTRSVKCAGDFITAFFDNPEKKVDTTCPESLEAPKFSGPLYQTNGVLRLATLMSEDKKKIALPALWFGLCAVTLLFAFIIYLLSPIARLINRDAAAGTLGARPLAFLTALLGAASVIGLGAAIGQTVSANGILMITGLVGMARWAVLAGYVAGLAGLGLAFLTVRARLNNNLPVGSLTGLAATALAAIGLMGFYAVFGFAPF